MSTKKPVIGIDIGGTKILAAVVSKGGKVSKSVTVPSEAKKGKPAVIKALFSAISAVSSGKPGAIGIGIAGSVDHEKGVFRHGPNFSPAFTQVRLAEAVKKKFGARTTVDNDVHCFTLAEAKFGSAKRFSRVVGLAVGTGIGGGIVTDGVLVRGSKNLAGEFGHMTIVAEEGIPCSCGQTGHLESYASGTAMTAMYRTRTGMEKKATEIEVAARGGEDAAKEVVALCSRMFAIGVANLVQTLDPDIIVVGGGLSRTNVLLGPARPMIRASIAFPELKGTPVVRAALGQESGVIGAALITGTL